MLISLLVIAFAGLGYRLVEIQLVQHEEILPQAEKQTRKTFVFAPLRGRILDCRQTILAASETVKTICADPSLIGPHSAAVARAIAPLLKLDERQLAQRLQPVQTTNAAGRVVERQYVRLKQKVAIEDWEKVRQTMRQLDLGVAESTLTRAERKFCDALRKQSVFALEVDDQLRVYPNGTLAAHVLGFVGSEEKTAEQKTYFEMVGKTGIELMLDKALSGVPGWRNTEVYSSRELVPYRNDDIDAHNGNNVVLTIDAGVQHILESELAEAMRKYSPASACGIVVRPRTGEIVAMATIPTFDPNKVGATSEETWRNRAITDIYEPGSTFKIVAVSGALNDGMVTLQTRYDCDNGIFWFANHRLKDDHRMGIATVEDIIAKSSNIGTAKIAIQMGRQRVYDYVRAFGFGQETGLGLQGEVAGILAPAKKWSQLQFSRIPIGQGIAVTPLQMVMAMSAIANRGRLMEPMIVSRLIDEEGHVIIEKQPHVVRQIVSEPAAEQMIAALKHVVSTNGTGIKAVLEHYTAAGKTGTAEKPGVRGYIHGKYVASFMGFLPADNAELCIGIVLDDPKPVYYGAQTAAPTFRAVAERAAKYLALKPDILPAGSSPESELASHAGARKGAF